MSSEPVFGVKDFVAALNQTLEFAYPYVSVVGEISNFKISKNRWVYFDLKDEEASVRCFGTVYQLPGPLEDGLVAQVRATPRLHQQFGFSLNLHSIQPVGEGSLRRAATLLEAKLMTEGLFDPTRKRSLPYPPQRIGLITSSESAAYHDFLKILAERWGGIEIELIDIQVQGEQAPPQIIAAIEYFNSHANPMDTLVITRGGGSADDLAAFSTEQVVRAVAASRIPTIVAIGHEVDSSLAEMAADQRASTPSNAAQLLVPDKHQVLSSLGLSQRQLDASLSALVSAQSAQLAQHTREMHHLWHVLLEHHRHNLISKHQLLEALNPHSILSRGYAIVRQHGVVVRSIRKLKPHNQVVIELKNGSVNATVGSKVQ